MSMKTATKRIPIIEELFYDTKGDLLKSPDVITFRAQDNYANLLVINLEDGIEDGSLVLVNFTPKNAVVSYTSHWFYARPLQNVREYIIVGEATPRVFSSYVIEVPRLVLNNYKENTTIENEITIVKRYGFHDLGVFNNYTDLINAHPANVELEQNNGFAYILNDSTVGGVLRKKGYYQVIYDNGNYTWVVRDNVMNFGLEQKQYETKKAFIAPGYANIKNVPNVESTVIEALWRDLSVIINDINDLKAFYDLQFATQETDTVYLEIDKVNESYFTVKVDVKIDEVENDLLEVGANGLYVKHDISKAEKDLVDDIKETLDTHIEDLSNPHEVNAEQINTYEKEVIDQKDLDTLNEAKGYTYSQDIIDAKDQAILQEAKDYASEVADTFTKNEIIARDQAVLDEAKEYTDTNFVSNTTLDLQLLEKLNIRPNGTDLLVVGGKINTVYIDSLYITDIETVGTIPEMLALPNMKRGDIAIVVDENSSYVLTQTPSNVLGNWAKLLVQPSVISVNGKTGVVSIGISDIENLQGILDGKLSIITYESDKVILEQQIATSHLPKGFTTGTSPNYNVNIPNLVLSDGLQIAVSFNEANTAPPYLSLNSGTLIKINTLYGTALSPLILPNRYYILTYHIATNVWTIQMYNQMTNADIVNKTTEPKVISGKVLGDRLDEVESDLQTQLDTVESDLQTKLNTVEFDTFKTQNTQRINAVENGLQLQLDELEFVESIVLNGNDLDITYRNGNITKVPVNEAVESGYYDEASKELVLILANGDEIRIPVEDIIAGLASVDYVDSGLATKENTSNKISSINGVLNNTQYMGAKLTNDLIIAVKNDLEVLINGKQEKLVSGVNLKTLGMQSLLGSGNISIPSTDEFASKQELAPYISAKNLAMPDLTGKEYLGDGVYRLYDDVGLTIDYNVYSGVNEINGTANITTGFSYVHYIFDSSFNPMIMSFHPISGTKTVGVSTISNYSSSGTPEDINNISLPLDNNTSTIRVGNPYVNEWGLKRNLNFYISNGTTFNNYQFKIQLEKGSTATPFAVPAGVIPYIPEVKTQFDSKLDKNESPTTNPQSYVKLANGTNTMIDAVASGAPLTLVLRSSNGTFDINDATSPYHPIPMGQADGRYAKSDWTLIATNSSNTGDIISIPSGYKEVLITANGHSTVHLPNISNVQGVSIRSVEANTIQTGATWRIDSGSLIKSWGTGVTTTVISYRIYGR